MDKLDITTSHNIVVTVELADVTQRILATVIDSMVVGFYCLLVSLISIGSGEFAAVLMLPVLLCYHLIMEYFNDGQSLGKKALKLKVVSLTGDRPELLDLVMRWMFRLVDLAASAGMLGIIFISSTKKKQRIGDILANTAVIRIQNDNFVTLDSILELSSDSYAVTFPQVSRYSDADMLLVKQAIIRHQKKPTADNRRLLYELSKKISTDFNIKNQAEDRLTFLRTILNDYVVLTR